MSGNAALAAAKRRRNPATANEPSHPSMQEQMQKPVRKPQSVPELLVEHDRKIFVLERKLEDTQLAGGTAQDGQSVAVANNAENMAKGNAAEIKMLKGAMMKQAKSFQDSQTLLTTLRATLNTQTAELNGLKSIRDELAELKESINKKESVENDNSDDNKVELEVSEKDDQ